jgi:TonB family protein
MIPRSLVPFDVRPVDENTDFAPGKRLYSPLDHRIIIPAGLPARPADGRQLDGHTSIPSFVPLDVLAPRTLVQRGMPIKPFTVIGQMPAYFPLEVLGTPVVVPRDVEPAPPMGVLLAGHNEIGALPPELLELREPDVLTTGEVTFLPEHANRQRIRLEGASGIVSIAFHVVLILVVLFSSKVFPGNPPAAVEAPQQLNYLYLPPNTKDILKKEERPSPPSPRIRVDPLELRRLAPNPHPELPPGPVPQPDVAPASNQPPQPQPAPARPSPQPSTSNMNAAPRQPAPTPRTSNGLTLPNLSPGSAIQQSMRQALQGGGSGGSFGSALPQGPGGGGGPSGPGQLGGNLEMLTPTDGVDFTNYFQRLLASVKRNWYAIIPESARMGDKGKVVIQFRIQTNGTVPYPEPNLVRSSGKEPLDRAAMGAISASSPFEPLPTAYTRPYIELRFTFLYNLPIGAQ